MRNICTSLLVALVMLFTSCGKDELINPESEAALLQGDYLVFGSAAPECDGINCAKLFLLQGNKLYPDDMIYLSETLKFDNNALPADKYNLAKQLLSKFPNYLRKHPNKTFGCPGCMDQEQLYLEIKKNNKITRWHIDTVVEEQPAEIRSYIQTLLSVLKEL